MNHKVRSRKVRFDVVSITEALRVARVVDSGFPVDKQPGVKATEGKEEKVAGTPKAGKAGNHVASSIRGR